jgi:hypothetical protein
LSPVPTTRLGDPVPILRLMRDGSVVVTEHGEPDCVLDPTDPLSLLVHIRSLPEFEDGLTAHELMRCLRPWSGILSKMAWLDFGRWDRAMAEPPTALLSDFEDTDAGEDEPPLRAVALAPIVRGTVWKKGRMTLTISWETHGIYAWPRKDRDTESEDLFCSLTFSPPHSWAHLPLHLERRAWIFDNDHTRKRRRILDAEIQSSGTAPSRLELTPSFLEAVVIGFLNSISFYGDPEETATVFETIAERARSVQLGGSLGNEFTFRNIGLDDEEEAEPTKH